MRPKLARLGGRRISRFSRRLLPCMPGVSDLAGYQRPLPKRNVDCGLPLLLTGSASRTNCFSRLNTQPALSPVNASTAFLQTPPHDSGSSWLARPLTFETFIQYNHSTELYRTARGGGVFACFPLDVMICES
jgi:hypothetical protein